MDDSFRRDSGGVAEGRLCHSRLPGSHPQKMQRLIIPLLAALSAAAPAAAAGAAQPACATGQAAAPALARLGTALAHGRFVTYQPTALTVSDGRIVSADAASIRADLSVLRPRFDSLVTYDAIHGAEEIPAIAAALRFRALIIGVWNPLDEAELRAAGDAVRRHPDLVVGLSLGNELLFAGRSDPGALGSLIARLHERLPATGGRAFAYFAAFDAPWRAYDALAAPGARPGVHPEEAHWGLYGADREPKQAARELPPLTSPPSPP